MTDAPAQRTATAEFWLGVRHELPLQLGVIPFGLVFGILGLASGLTSLQTILLSSILFGGASQVVFAQLWAAGVPPLIVGGSVSVVNLRHVLYSASMAQYLAHLPLRWRILLGYLLTDEAYAVSIKRFQDGPKTRYQHYHLLGSGTDLMGGLANLNAGRGDCRNHHPRILVTVICHTAHLHRLGGTQHPAARRSCCLCGGCRSVTCLPAVAVEILDYHIGAWRHCRWMGDALSHQQKHPD